MLVSAYMYICINTDISWFLRRTVRNHFFLTRIFGLLGLDRICLTTAAVFEVLEASRK